MNAATGMDGVRGVRSGAHSAEELLDACIEARALFVVAWTAWLGPDLPGRRERLAVRLAWLRRRGQPGAAAAAFIPAASPRRP